MLTPADIDDAAGRGVEPTRRIHPFCAMMSPFVVSPTLMVRSDVVVSSADPNERVTSGDRTRLGEVQVFDACVEDDDRHEK